MFRDRSPIHSFDRIVAPMLITQGLDDKVVPPSQLDAMVAALHGRGIPHAAIALRRRGPRLPQGRVAPAGRPRPSCRSSARSSGSRPRTTSSRSWWSTWRPSAEVARTGRNVRGAHAAPTEGASPPAIAPAIRSSVWTSSSIVFLNGASHEDALDPTELGGQRERHARALGGGLEPVLALRPHRPRCRPEGQPVRRLECGDLVVRGDPSSARPADPLGIGSADATPGDELDVEDPRAPGTRVLAVRDEREDRIGRGGDDGRIGRRRHAAHLFRGGS